MHKWFPAAFVGTVVLFSASLIAYGGGSGNGGSGKGGSSNSPSQVCKANDDFGFSHDTCVICLAQEKGNVTPACACKIAEEDGAFEFLGFDNLGECISSGFTGLF